MIVRDALDADTFAITDIYNAWIPTHTITWTETPETFDERAAWLHRQQQRGFPVLVAEDDSEIVGFTTYEPFRGEGKWPGYSHTAELSIHVRESHWRRGIGRALLSALFDRAQAGGIHVLVAAIDSENEASLRFHSQLGFVEVGRMPETGRKFDRWLDLIFMQRILDSPPRQ
jgi:phosphinothricin acetyltransferase